MSDTKLWIVTYSWINENKGHPHPIPITLALPVTQDKRPVLAQMREMFKDKLRGEPTPALWPHGPFDLSFAEESDLGRAVEANTPVTPAKD
jgi:hypothetical protein